MFFIRGDEPEMSVFNDQRFSKEDQEMILKIAQIYLFYYETFTNKKSNNIKFQDSNKELFNGDKFIFGRCVLQMFALFAVEANHPPLREFDMFPTVADVVLYIFENKQ